MVFLEPYVIVVVVGALLTGNSAFKKCQTSAAADVELLSSWNSDFFPPGFTYFPGPRITLIHVMHFSQIGMTYNCFYGVYTKRDTEMSGN